MAPAATKSKAYSNPISTQADDVKYRTKYKELKVKVNEIEEDNTKLSVKILKSKKAIQRLRIERAILYDRLQSTVAPTNPYSLSSATHLSTLAASQPSTSTSSASTQQPPSILNPPSYPLADPSAPSLFLQQLDARKLAAVQNANSDEPQFGEMSRSGIVGESKEDQELNKLLNAGGPIEGSSTTTSQAQSTSQNGTLPGFQPATTNDSNIASSSATSIAAVPQTVEVPHQEPSQPQPQAQSFPVEGQNQMQVDQA